MKLGKRRYRAKSNADALRELYDEYHEDKFAKREVFEKLSPSIRKMLIDIYDAQSRSLLKCANRVYTDCQPPAMIECPFCGGVMRKHAGAPTEHPKLGKGSNLFDVYVINTNQFSVPTGDGRNYYCEKCMTIISPTGKLLVRAGRILIPIKEEE